MPSLASARQKSYVDDSVTTGWQRGGVSARGAKDTAYELSDDFRQKQIEALGRKYGGNLEGIFFTWKWKSSGGAAKLRGIFFWPFWLTNLISSFWGLTEHMVDVYFILFDEF